MKRASYMYLKVTINTAKKNDARISFSKFLCRNSFTDEIFLTFLQAHLVFIIIGGTSVLYASIMANKSNKEPSSSFLFVNEGICMRPLRAL